jgi:hypothetical protein
MCYREFKSDISIQTQTMGDNDAPVAAVNSNLYCSAAPVHHCWLVGLSAVHHCRLVGLSGGGRHRAPRKKVYFGVHSGKSELWFDTHAEIPDHSLYT